MSKFFIRIAAVIVAAGVAMTACMNPAGSYEDDGAIDGALVATWHSTQAAANKGESAVFEITAGGRLTGDVFNAPATVTTSKGRISAAFIANGQTMDGGSADYEVRGTELKFSNPSPGGTNYFYILNNALMLGPAVGGSNCYYKSAGGGDPGDTLVTGVSLDNTTISVLPGQTVTLTAIVEPSNATNQAVTWKSNNESVATVTNGVVTGVAKGTTIITVTTVDGNKTAVCTVTVTTIGKPQVAVNFTGPRDETIDVYENRDSGSLLVSVSDSFSHYRWFLDGVLLKNETSNSYTLDTEKFLPGRHELTVFVTGEDGVEYAKALRFTVFWK
ncbi:MAG: Ig-like domain-containing protein [Treponema sp.]|jgi:hypothetical protein|nr:Ig-like domain-containing protein [Treponema sp.]